MQSAGGWRENQQDLTENLPVQILASLVNKSPHGPDKGGHALQKYEWLIDIKVKDAP